jgi:hypothetical protein
VDFIIGTAEPVMFEDLRLVSTLLFATGSDLRAFTLFRACVSRFGASLLDARICRDDGGVSAAKVCMFGKKASELGTGGVGAIGGTVEMCSFSKSLDAGRGFVFSAESAVGISCSFIGATGSTTGCRGFGDNAVFGATPFAFDEGLDTEATGNETTPLVSFPVED